MDRVQRHIVLPLPPERVWRAITDPGHLSAWMGAKIELDVRPGGRGTARRVDGVVRRIRVETVDPPHRLAFRWWPYECGQSPPGPGSRVEIVVEEAARGGTRLTVSESRVPATGTPSAMGVETLAGAR